MDSEVEICGAAASLEDLAAKLAGGFSRCSVRSMFLGSAKRLNPLRNWIWLRNSDGETLALAFDMNSRDEDSDYFFRLLDLASMMGDSGGLLDGWFLVDECPGYSPRQELEFALFDGNFVQTGSMQMAFSSPAALLKVQSCPTWSLERLGQQTTRLALWQVENQGPSFLIGEEISFLVERVEDHEEAVLLSVKEVIMERKDLEEKLQAGVYLGGIAISLDDLLRLRPGMSIEFARPETFPVTIRAGGCDWAKGRLSLTESSASLQVEKLLAVGNMSTGQETFGSNSRLVSGETSKGPEISSMKQM